MNRAEKRRQQKLAKKAAGRSPNQQSLANQQHLGLAIQHHNAGRLSEAEGLYQQILHTDPDQPDALHLLGLIANQAGKKDTAVDLIAKALAVKPDYAEAHINLGNVLKDLGKLEAAVESYHKAIAIKPDYAEAHSNLGVALKDSGKLAAAMESYHKAIAINPDYAEAHSNLGVALKDSGKLEAAIESYHKAIAIKPDYAEAHSNLGLALQQLEKLEAAMESYHKAIAIKPDYAEAHSNLGVALKDSGKLEEAVESFSRALELMPANATASIALSQTLYGISARDAERARELALHVTAAFPKDDILRRGVGGIAPTVDYSPEAERLYTTSIFKNFAKTFDVTLGKLLYDMPEKLARAACTVDGGADLDILDAGCGTGLCGVHLRARARRMVGVDLSANMLAEARGKGLYDDLVEADLVTFIENNPASFDVVLAADVLIYIGDVAPLAQAAYLALRPGGVCAVSAESLDGDAGSPFLLSPSGRYQHTEQYVRETFTTAGFTVDPPQKTSVRLENAVPIPAWIVVGRK